jgi:glycine/D-amino acid oxidase-like deaminating enzyme
MLACRAGCLQVHPALLTKALVESAQQRGVQVVKAAVTGLELDGEVSKTVKGRGLTDQQVPSCHVLSRPTNASHPTCAPLVSSTGRLRCLGGDQPVVGSEEMATSC